MNGRSHDVDAELNIGNPDEQVVYEIAWRPPEGSQRAPVGLARPNPWGQFGPPAPARGPVPWLRRLIGGWFTPGSDARPRPRRVVLSHTSELRRHPQDRSFVTAAEAAVCRAGHAIVDMEYLSAADAGPADRCASMVASADVYVGIIGLRYGSLVPGRADQSFTELEFETATLLGLPRLIFIIPADGQLPPADQPDDRRLRQDAFRSRLQGVAFASVVSPAELEIDLYQALVELVSPIRPTGGRDRTM